MSMYSDLAQVLAAYAAKINGLLTGYDGTEYSTPGEAVRTQINDLHVLIGDEPGTAIVGTSVSYDGSDSGLSADNMQGAVDEVADALSSTNERLGGISDLETTDKANLVAAINENEQTLKNLADLAKGTLGTFPAALFTTGDFDTTTGEPRHNVVYRACTKEPVSYGEDIALYIPSGYRVYVSLVNNGTLGAGGWKTTAFFISAGQKFCCTIARVTEDHTETVNVADFINNIRVCRTIDLLADANIISNSEISTSTGVTTWNQNSNYSCTDFVPLPSGIKPVVGTYAYTGSTRARVAFYDADKEFISAIGATTQSIIYTDIPNNAAYVRVGSHSTIPFGSVTAFVMTEGYAEVTSEDAVKAVGADYSESATITANHRGYNTVAPENTIPAFKLSAQNGFTVVETDLRKTSDGVYVLLHDASINRTARETDGSELESTVNIADITYAEALAYDFGIWMGSEYAGTKIPTLKEALVFCKRVGLSMMIEIEASAITTDAEIREVIGIINGTGMKDKVMLTCFYQPLLQYVLMYEPSFDVGVNVDTAYTAETFPLVAFNYLRTGKNNAVALFRKTRITEEIVSFMADNNIPLGMWLATSLEEALSYDPYISYYLSNSVNVTDGMRSALLS